MSRTCRSCGIRSQTCFLSAMRNGTFRNSSLGAERRLPPVAGMRYAALNIRHTAAENSRSTNTFSSLAVGFTLSPRLQIACMETPGLGPEHQCAGQPGLCCSQQMGQVSTIQNCRCAMGCLQSTVKTSFHTLTTPLMYPQKTYLLIVPHEAHWLLQGVCRPALNHKAVITYC